MNRYLRIPDPCPETPSWAGGFGADTRAVFADIVWGKVVYRLRWIEPGTFMMGSPTGEAGRFDDEGPRHEVRIPHGFWLGETPITQEFYEAVTGSNPSHFRDDVKETVKRPVEQVSWYDCKAFCERLAGMLPTPCEHTVRLPSEAEWEYACRAGTTTALYNGKELTSEMGRCRNLDELAWYDENSDGKTHPVKGKAPNAWGLYDMHGNVWEWCEDHWHGNYKSAPNDGSAWVDEGAEKGAIRVVRGGSWLYGARYCRSACRYRSEPDSRWSDGGFRLVLARSSTTDSLEQSEGMRAGAAASAERGDGGAGRQRPGKQARSGGDVLGEGVIGETPIGG